MALITFLASLNLWLMLFGYDASGMAVVEAVPGVEKECSGTFVGFGFSGSARFHYNNLRRRYRGCTLIRGNLELTNLDDESINYDLSFLRTIRTVTGYVLIGLVEVETIPLVNLQLIRGDNLFKISNESYGLVVALTSDREQTTGVRHLLMPALREISKGKVLFSQNPLLCHINTIRWDLIVHQHIARLVFKRQPHRQDCEPCDDYCSIEGNKHCWGPGPHNCQTVIDPRPCPSGCQFGCYHRNGHMRCCHHLCAGGCWGPSSANCQLCKYYYADRRCLRRCPSATHPVGQQCHPER